MKLTDILRLPRGATVVWLWQRESDKITSPSVASRRVHTYLAYRANAGVRATTKSVMVVCSEDGSAEPATEITIL